ncbi:MAG: hypothetical protein ACT4OZ_14170 [Gemmatimonadota bacterium]
MTGTVVRTILALGALSSGCSYPTTPVDGPLRVQTTATTYSAGTQVQITLTNVGSERLYYSACPSEDFELEIRTTGHAPWRLMRQPSEPGLCPAVIHDLPPGATRMLRHDLSEGLPGGWYRLVLSVDGDERLTHRSARATNIFKVQ